MSFQAGKSVLQSLTHWLTDQCSEYEYVLKVQLDTTAKSPRQVHAWKCSLRSFNPSPSWDFGYEQGLYYEKHPLVFISVFASHMRYVVGHNLIFLLGLCDLLNIPKIWPLSS